MQQYSQLFQLFNVKLEEEINFLKTREPANLYEPVIYTLNMGGKRIRPVLLLMAYDLYKSDYEEALPVAIAIELFHNFTLLHDDIMDNAGLRRNYQTVHLKYSNEKAILSGDAMSILSYEYLNRCQSNNYKAVFDLFTKTALQICEGQQYDMDFENRNNVTVDEYLKMIGLKTAVLLAASLKIGALIANASLNDANLLYDFGYHLGIAFQLQDDLLDTFGNTESFGKNIGGDISANKKTFLLLKAFELSNENQFSELTKLISETNVDREEKISNVKKMFTDLGVADISKIEMEKNYSMALESFGKLDLSAEKKKYLLEVASQLMNRDN